MHFAHSCLCHNIVRLTLQEYSNKLIIELCECKQRVVEFLEELTMAEEQVAVSRESIKDLKKFVHDLMMMERQDRMGKDWQTMYERLSLQITESESVKNQLLEALSAKVDKVNLIKRSAAENVDELHVKINTLKADLEHEVAKEKALSERVIQWEESRRLEVVSQTLLVPESRMSCPLLDLDQCSSRNRNMDNGISLSL